MSARSRWTPVDYLLLFTVRLAVYGTPLLLAAIFWRACVAGL